MHTVDQITFTRSTPGSGPQIILTIERDPQAGIWTACIGHDVRPLAGCLHRSAAELYPGLFSSHPRVTNLKVDCISVIGPGFDQAPDGTLVTVSRTYQYSFIDTEYDTPVSLLEAAGHLPSVVMYALDEV